MASTTLNTTIEYGRFWNSTANGTLDTFDYELEWLVCNILTIPLGLTALYTASTQTAYCILKAKNSRSRSSRKYSNSSVTEYKRKTATTTDKYASVLNSMIAFSAICAFLRAGFDFRWIFGNYSDLGCDLSIKFKLANYVLSLVTTYLVLWLRQRIFYQHPRLKHLSSRFIRVVSWSMSVVILGCLLTTSVLFFAVGKYVGTPKGCTVQKGPLTSIRWIILIACTTFFQICLLTLFVYPLAKHNTSVKSNAGDGKKNPIIPLIKRATITSAICVVTDIGFALLILVLKKQIVTFSTFIYDVNIVVNALCMIFSFPDWSTRLMPWRIKQNESSELDSSTGGATSINRTSESHVLNSATV